MAPTFSRIGIFLLVFAGYVFAAGQATARVNGITIQQRTVFADGIKFGAAGSYEILKGRLSYSIDPKLLANHKIVDLALAPTDNNGKVVFSGDFVLLKPMQLNKSNGRLVMEITNRGNLALLSFFNFARFNNDPATMDDAGDGFLLKQGYSMLWTA